MKTKNTWGGPRPGAGRPKGSGKGRRVVTRSINLPPEVWAEIDRLRGPLSRSKWIAEMVRSTCGLAACQAIINLMEQRGFCVGRGTYAHPSGQTLPTWRVTRPDAPDWSGVWSPWDERPDHVEDGEAQVLLEVCRLAISKWDEEAHLFGQADEPK
jgi:hypothetical protein